VLDRWRGGTSPGMPSYLRDTVRDEAIRHRDLLLRAAFVTVASAPSVTIEGR